MDSYPSDQLPNIIIQDVDTLTDSNLPIPTEATSAMDTDSIQSDADYVDGCGITSLLNEELAKIFSFLSVQERQLIRPVCSQWKDLIDVVFGMKVRIKNSINDLIKSCPWAINVELNSMTIPIDNGISFADTVRILTFSNIVVTYNLVTFLRACKNIKYLGFVNIVIDQPVNERWNPVVQENELIPLPRIETLEVKAYSFVEGIIEVFSFLSENVTLTKLTEVKINVQNPTVLPLQILLSNNAPNPTTTHPLLRLLRKNLHTLKFFSIGRPTMPTFMKFYDRQTTEPFEYNPDEPNYPELEHIEIHPYFREEWSPLLRNQTRIRLMHLGSCNVSRWAEVQQAISANSQTLESFSIGGLSFGQVWDCAVFQNCTALKDLFIEISHSHKAHLNLLPRQLKSLHMFGPIAKQEIASLAETLFDLETLRFTHLGRIAEFNGGEDDKITLDIFKSLLQLPKLTVMILTACSTISIDWDTISNWCAFAKRAKGFVYFERFHTVHGQDFRNGITVELSDEFDRNAFDWNKELTTTRAPIVIHRPFAEIAIHPQPVGVVGPVEPQPQEDDNLEIIPSNEEDAGI